MIECIDIHKKYGDTTVLRGINLEIEPHKISCILGPSGAGKSSLLNIIGTLSSADRGDIIINGQNINKLKGKQLDAFRSSEIGFVFQFHNLLPEFSALENVMIPGWINGQISRPKVRSRATELLKLMGLEHRLQHKPSQLSGGEQQRVAVARALMNSPKIILADEPSGNLDSENRRELYDIFFQLRDQSGQTFLIVTHDQELADRSDREIIMQDGLIL